MKIAQPYGSTFFIHFSYQRISAALNWWEAGQVVGEDVRLLVLALPVVSLMGKAACTNRVVGDRKWRIGGNP